MRKNNWIYVIYSTFTSDLLFWIVIDNLFLTTVKGFEAFEVVLITMLGIAFSLVLYPLTNYIVKKTSNKTSIVLGSLFYCIAISLFMICNTIYGFIIGQIIYNMTTPFRVVSNLILKNNLKEQNKEGDFVKWQSYGKLGYAIITLVVSLVAGVLFNIFAYLPMILSLGCAIIGVCFSIIYCDLSETTVQQSQNTKIWPIIKNKTMVYIMLMNVIAVGTYVFLHTKATLLIQFVCETENMDLAKISLIVSGIVFGSRLVRVISNTIFPAIYKKIKSKQNLLLWIGTFIVVSSILFAVGANINANYVVNFVIIALGFYIILAIRDMYTVFESKIISVNIPDEEQKQAFVLASIYDKFGRLLSNGIALIILGFVPLNIVYIYMIILAILQMFICIPFAKILKNKVIQ